MLHHNNKNKPSEMFANFTNEANRKQNLGQVVIRTLKVEHAAEACRIHTESLHWDVFSRHPIFIHHAIIFKSRKGPQT